MSASSAKTIRTAIVGAGNCASSLIQGVAYCRALGDEAVGVPFPVLGGYRPEDVDIVLAFEVGLLELAALGGASGRPLGQTRSLPTSTR